MAGIIDEAIVRIRPDLSGFERELKTGLNRSFGIMDERVKRSTVGITRRFEESDKKIVAGSKRVQEQSSSHFKHLAESVLAGGAAIEGFEWFKGALEQGREANLQ